MDLSEFKPPVRLSMSDEEIYQALGSAQASEDGIAKAMAIVEEQANLREHDNKLFNEWVARMQSSEAPEAKIALENIERAKQNLEPLPLTPPAQDIASSLNAVYAAQTSEAVVESEAESVEPIEIVEVAEVVDEEEPLKSIFANLESEPVVESIEDSEVHQFEKPLVQQLEVVVEEAEALPVEDEFDALLADASAEATTSISFAPAMSEPAVTFDNDEAPVSNFAVSADEDALVFEEEKADHPKSGWWANASFWVLTVGVFVPVIASYVFTSAGMNFGTAIVGFGLGLLANLVLIVSAHFTAQRTSEPNVVTSRATFGVFGAIIPGVTAIGFALAVLNLSSVGAVATFDGVFEGGFDFSQELFSGVSVSSAIAIGLAIAALLVAGFAARALRWLNLVAAGLLVPAFIVGALITRNQISTTIDMSVDLGQAALVAGIFTAVGFATYGRAPKVLPSIGAPRTIARWSAITGVTVVLPLAAFAHFALIFKANLPGTGFELLTPLGLTETAILATPVLWVAAFAMFVLLVNLGQTALVQLRAFGLNQMRGWLTIVVSLAATAIYVAPSWAFWLQISQLLLVPLATGVGFAVAESVIRRGQYHEASLLRGYGFYGKFNLVAVIGFAVVVAFGLGISEQLEIAPWLGFAGWSSPLAPLAAFGLGAVWTAVTGVPRILLQQREVAEVELRKASLTSFSGFAE